MKVLFDSSLLIAACLEHHPKHIPAFEWLKKAKKKQVEGCVSAHSILESFSVLTRAPFKPKISPREAGKLIHNNIIPHAQIITIGIQDYIRLMDVLSGKGLGGGIVYDGLILCCALKVKAARIVTSNPTDFQRLARAFDSDIEVLGV